MTKILIIGANGLLGNALLKFFSINKNFIVAGTVRNKNSLKNLDFKKNIKIYDKIEAQKPDNFLKVFKKFNPDIVVNCIGVTKQNTRIKRPDIIIFINSVLPHYIADLCTKCRARFIHISTDCVFSGLKGNYKECDFPDANDLYGRSKFLGEVIKSNSITLRTSIIGHELSRNKSLLNWFLSQNKKVKGYRKAVFSGLPTYEIGKIIHEFVIPNTTLKGLYHLSSNPINKYDLLCMIKNVYKKNIKIIPDDKVIINRSLNSLNFQKKTGYSPKNWEILVREMKHFE